MRKPVRYAAVAIVIVAAAAAVAGTVARPALSATTPVRIMPLGDSITGGPGCWRALLWNRLQTSGFTNIDFVGTLPGGGCGVSNWDGDNEGHGGIAATGMADQNQLSPWLAATRPDIVLMHLGTNDIWGNISTDRILTAYGKLIDAMRASNPSMRVLVAQIIPMNPSGCAACASAVVALDNAIPGWAASKTTAQSPITVVDQWTGFDTVADTTGDGVHPDDSGFQKMSDRWYPPLAQLLAGGTPAPSGSRPVSASPSASRPVSASPSASRPVSASPSASRSVGPSGSPGGACAAQYRVVSEWTGGFQGEVTVKNSGAVSSSGWTATVVLGQGQSVTQSWNATVTQSGSTLTARNLSWNGSLAPGAATTFGFLATGGGGSTAATAGCALG